MNLGVLKKANSILIFCFLLIIGLYWGASLLIPFTTAIFLATLVLPLLHYMERRTGIGKITSSIVGVLIIFIGIGLLAYLLAAQLKLFIADVVERQDQIVAFIQGVRETIHFRTGFSLEEQEAMIRERMGGMISTSQNVASQVLFGTGDFLLNFLLVLVFIFLLLLNRGKFMTFVMKYIQDGKQEEARQIITETTKVAHKYLWGRIQVMGLLAIMYAITFSAYGLRHTWLLVIFGALITVIPYIGPFLSAVLPILFMIIFGGSSVEIFSFITIVFVIQLIESYVFEPVIIGAEVHQSPLFVIIAILLGGALWGIAGLILFVPLFAILKILFDHTPSLEPIGVLMGYESKNSGKGVLEKIKEKIRK